MKRPSILPNSLPPIGLSREAAAEFIGVSPSKFDEMVKDGRMPKPKHIDSRRVWSRTAVEKAFARLPSDRPDEDEDDMWAAS